MTIDTADQRLLKRAVFVQLKSELSEYGFNLKVAKGTFRRQHDDVTDIFQLVFLDKKIDDQPGSRVDPAVGVRIEKVEEIFHQTSVLTSSTNLTQ